MTDNTSKSRNKQRVVPDNAPSQVPNSEYSVRQAYQRKPESDSTSQYEISSKSRRENEAFTSAEELLLKYRHSMERYSEQVDENKKKLSLALSRKKYEETVDSLKALKYVYEKMIDNTEQAISRMKKAGLQDSNKQMIELNETYKDLQREYGSVERQLSTLPKPKPVGKLIALMAVIVIGIIIAIMAITYSSNSGVTITITNGSVIANGGN